MKYKVRMAQKEVVRPMLFRKLSSKEAEEFRLSVVEEGHELEWNKRKIYHPATRLSMAAMLISEVLGLDPKVMTIQEILASHAILLPMVEKAVLGGEA